MHAFLTENCYDSERFHARRPWNRYVFQKRGETIFAQFLLGRMRGDIQSGTSEEMQVGGPCGGSGRDICDKHLSRGIWEETSDKSTSGEPLGKALGNPWEEFRRLWQLCVSMVAKWVLLVRHPPRLGLRTWNFEQHIFKIIEFNYPSPNRHMHL